MVALATMPYVVIIPSSMTNSIVLGAALLLYIASAALINATRQAVLYPHQCASVIVITGCVH